MEAASKLHFLEHQDGMLKNKFHLNSWMNLRAPDLPSRNETSVPWGGFLAVFVLTYINLALTTRKRDWLWQTEQPNFPKISLILNFLRENRRTWCDWLCETRIILQPKTSAVNISEKLLAEISKDFFFLHTQSASWTPSPNFFMFNFQLFSTKSLNTKKLNGRFLERL